VPLNLTGDSGIGKTEIIQQYCAKNNLPLVIFYGSQVESAEVRGMPFINNETGMTRFAPLEEFDMPLDKPFILLLDEINRARPEVINSLFQLISCGKIGSKKYNAYIIATSNPGSLLFNVSELDDAGNNRFVHVVVSNSCKSLSEYLIDKHKNSHASMVAAFLSNTIVPLNRPSSLPNILATPRSFERAIAIMEVGKNINCSSDILKEVLCGILPLNIVTSLDKYILEVDPKMILEKGISIIGKRKLTREQLLGLCYAVRGHITKNLPDEYVDNVADFYSYCIEHDISDLVFAQLTKQAQDFFTTSTVISPEIIISYLENNNKTNKVIAKFLDNTKDARIKILKRLSETSGGQVLKRLFADKNLSELIKENKNKDKTESQEIKDAVAR
jgi:hypothetical protein